MPQYFFIRSVPLLVGVTADAEPEAWIEAGNRVDDFMTDAMESVERISHVDESTYILEYQGDAIYYSKISERIKQH